ncbi:hypothetical protein L211DRAFT_497891 [Terfezia boudieri ATCC MYA-4762]|uniref:BTB domain-containing protein n=1 Tax=Terfezia boudieri ATCC MYA-4762 TaxID=1051890 RepID=A0A3N4LCQ9_9PEZI|nr:hypothetical protein L211DRAFT_497891 [Terfezia boudieri ATCC MYA-4762]
MSSTTVATSTGLERDDLRLTFSALEGPPQTPETTPPTPATAPVAEEVGTKGTCRMSASAAQSSHEAQPNVDSETPKPPKGPQITVVLRTGFKYYADEEVLCKLPFFALALREGYRETVTKVINMPDDDPELVQCLLQFLLAGEYRLPGSVEAYTTKGCKKEARMRLKLFHTSVLVLADKYMCVGLSRLAALNLRKIVLSPMSFVNYMVSVYEMTAPGSPLRIGYYVDYGYKDELLIVHPQWTISSHTRASITRLLESQSTEDRFIDALDRCPQLAIDLLSLISKGKQPVERTILQCPGAAKVILLHHCQQFYDKRPWTSTGEIVKIPWGWWKGAS